MKKLVCVLLLIAMLAMVFTGCDIGYFSCSLCGEEKLGVMYKDEVLGVEITYCQECHDELENLGFK